MKENILGYKVNAQSIDCCLDDLFASLSKSRNCLWLACFNPHSYSVALNDAIFSLALKNANWLIPDGTGVVVASCILGGGIRKRITGFDVFDGLNHRMNTIGGFSVFFLGASEKTLSLIRSKMADDYPNIRIAGTYSPPFTASFSASELEDMINQVNAAQPDVLWVSLTAPKQEKFIYQNRERLNVKFAGAVGAVFDFYSGKVKRSHPVFQRLGLEWLPRLIQEPKRLWKRMIISAPIFLYHAFFRKN